MGVGGGGAAGVTDIDLGGLNPIDVGLFFIGPGIFGVGVLVP